MKEITLLATLENLAPVQEFIESELKTYDCPMKAAMQISVAVEEIYVNIARYAYQPEEGEVTVRCSVGGNPLRFIVQFLDRGTPFNPLAQSDVDTTLSAQEREIGGLGILMVKRSMDDVQYQYKDGYNILTIKKQISKINV